MYSTRTRVQYTYIHVYTRASPTDILARKSARVGQVGGQVGVSGSWRAEPALPAARATAGRLPRRGNALPSQTDGQTDRQTDTDIVA